MGRFRDNKGLLGNRRFERFHQEEDLFLRRLTVEKGIKIMEGLLDSGLVAELKKVKRQLEK